MERGGHCSSKFLLTKTYSRLGQKIIVEIYNRHSEASEGKFVLEIKGDLKASAEDYTFRDRFIVCHKSICIYWRGGGLENHACVQGKMQAQKKPENTLTFCFK